MKPSQKRGRSATFAALKATSEAQLKTTPDSKADNHLYWARTHLYEAMKELTGQTGLLYEYPFNLSPLTDDFIFSSCSVCNLPDINIQPAETQND